MNTIRACFSKSENFFQFLKRASPFPPFPTSSVPEQLHQFKNRQYESCRSVKLQSNFFKITCEGANFQTNCIICNFSSELTYSYVLQISTTVFCIILFWDASFSEHLPVDIFNSIMLFLLKTSKINFLIYICSFKSFLKGKL